MRSWPCSGKRGLRGTWPFIFPFKQNRTLPPKKSHHPWANTSVLIALNGHVRTIWGKNTLTFLGVGVQRSTSITGKTTFGCLVWWAEKRMLVKHKSGKIYGLFLDKKLKCAHVWYCVVHFKSNICTLLLFSWIPGAVSSKEREFIIAKVLKPLTGTLGALTRVIFY